MQFQVPQFLDVEDKIVGPLSVKQVLYLAGGVGGAYAVWRMIPWGIVAWIPAAAIAGFGAGLAFYRYNNKPAIELLQAAFNYVVKGRLYVWRKKEKPQSVEVDLSNLLSTKHAKNIPGAAARGIADLSWKMDLKHLEESAEEADTGEQF